MKESVTALDTMSAMVSALDCPSQLPLGGGGLGAGIVAYIMRSHTYQGILTSE